MKLRSPMPIWLVLVLVLVLASASLGCSSSDAKKNDDACSPSDLDGLVSEPQTLELNVDDTAFSPRILTTQNHSLITLTFDNQGSTPHSFLVDCLPTPNSDGCPTQSCFPKEARIEPVAPGQAGRAVFETPLVEGIYTFRSEAPGDTASGQFIVQ